MRDNEIEIYSIQNEEKSVVAARFSGTLKFKIHNYVTLVSKNVSTDKLVDIVNKY